MQREFVRESYMHSGLPLAVSNLFFFCFFLFLSNLEKKNDSIFAWYYVCVYDEEEIM